MKTLTKFSSFLCKANISYHLHFEILILFNDRATMVSGSIFFFKRVPMTAGHLLLQNISPGSTRIFLRKYNSYWGEVRARASQLSAEPSATIKPAHPVSVMYCINAKRLKSACGMIKYYDDIGCLKITYQGASLNKS